MTEEYIQFNAHQEDVRRRIDSLAKAVFVIAGGALSISIGIFTNFEQISIDSCLATSLKFSWWSLVITIISLVLMLFTIITRDYLFAERWRKVLNGDVPSAENGPGIFDIFTWCFAVIGLASFIAGFIGLAYVATGIIGSS